MSDFCVNSSHSMSKKEERKKSNIKAADMTTTRTQQIKIIIT